MSDYNGLSQPDVNYTQDHIFAVKWRATQIKSPSHDDLTDADCFTCVEFNESGDLLAAGDGGGRITVYHTNKETGVYETYCAFTSHEPQFDYLKSLEIAEKIRWITWLPNCTSAHHLLTANNQTIKLWRLSERQFEAYNFNIRSDENSDLWPQNLNRSNMIGPPIPHISSPDELRVPRFRKAHRLTVEARLRRVFANIHTYRINAISMNSDLETFLSADDVRVNLWHLDVSNQSFTIVDLKPPDMQYLTEVITCARFHPIQCHLLAYSTSCGVIRLCDMRNRALCDNHVMVFEDPSPLQEPGVFAKIRASLCDFRFGHSGNYLLARDFFTLKIWDIRMGDRPCEVYSVHEPIRSQLCMPYESDSVFDKFLCGWSKDDRYISSGSYSNLFRIFDRHTGHDWLYDLNDCTRANSDASQSTPIVLIPKRFITPGDVVGKRLGLNSVYVAPLDVVESCLEVASPTSSEPSWSDNAHEWDLSEQRNLLFPVDLVPSLSGGDHSSDNSVSKPCTDSKRRKQVFPSRVTMEDDDEDADSEIPFGHSSQLSRNHSSGSHKLRFETVLINGMSSLNEENSYFEHNFDNFISDRRHRRHIHHHEKRRKCKFRQAMLPGLRDLDYQHKILHMSWHPSKLIMATVSNGQLYLVSGEARDIVNHDQSNEPSSLHPVTQPASSTTDITKVHTLSPDKPVQVASQIVQNNDRTSIITDPSMCVKPAKHRRRRHHASVDTISSPLSPEANSSTWHDTPEDEASGHLATSLADNGSV